MWPTPPCDLGLASVSGIMIPWSKMKPRDRQWANRPGAWQPSPVPVVGVTLAFSLKLFHFLILPQPRPPWHPLAPASQSPGVHFLPLNLDTSSSRNLGVLVTHIPRADWPAVLPLPAPGAVTRARLQPAFPVGGWRWCPKLPSMGWQAVPGSPEPWDILWSNGIKSQDWILGENSRRSVSSSTCLKGGRRSSGSRRREKATQASWETVALWTASPEI